MTKLLNKLDYTRTVVISMVAIGILIAVTSLPFAVNSGLTLDEVKTKAVEDCPKVQTALTDYLSNVVSDKYANANNTVTFSAGPYEIPGLKTGLTDAINLRKTEATTLCNAIAANTDLNSAASQYNQVIRIKTLADMTFNRMSGINNYYKKFQENVDALVYSNTLASCFSSAYNDLKASSSKIIIASSTALLQSALAVSHNPSLDDSLIDNVFKSSLTASLSQAQSSLELFNVRMNNNYNKLNSALNNYKNNGVKAGDNVLYLASATQKTAPGCWPYDNYDEIVNTYETRLTNALERANSDIDRLKTQLNTAKNKTAANLNGLTPPTATSTKNKITSLIADLDTKKTALNTPGFTLSSIESINQTVNDSGIKTAYLPMINRAFDFNKAILKAKEAKDTYTLFSSSFADLLAGLATTSDKTALEQLKTKFDKLNTDYLTALTGADKTANESSFLIISTSQIPTTANVTAFSAAIKAYATQAQVAASQFKELRAVWWQLINKAAINGTISPTSPLMAEQVAIKAFENFNAKRTAYFDKANKIITTRKIVIEKNQIIIDELTNVPAAKKTAVNFSGRSTTLLANNTTAGSLDKYYTDEIAPVTNYNELVAAVNGLKDFKLTEVYVPAQKLYIKLDNSYYSYAVMSTIQDALTLKMADIAANGTTTQQTRVAALVPAKDLITTQLADLLSSLNSSMDNMVTALDEKDADVIKTLNAQTVSISSKISRLKTAIKNLNNKLKEIEAIGN